MAGLADSTAELMIKNQRITSEVAAIYISWLNKSAATILPLSWDGLTDQLNTKMKACSDEVALIKLRAATRRQKVPWRNAEIILLKRKCWVAEQK